MEPTYWECGGPDTFKYGYGYWTGPQNDLLYIKPGIDSNEEAEKYLSPICNTKKEAKRAFENKREDFRL